MSNQFIGQISLFAGNYAPQGWAFCNGQSMSIADNQALYALIGVAYGGNGVTTFNLPDLRGRVPVGAGVSTPGGAINWNVGTSQGSENVTLSEAQMPAHNHPMQAASQQADATAPAGNTLAADAGGTGDFSYTADTSAVKPLLAASVLAVGGSQSHANVAPFMALNYIIATTGLFPSRN